MVVNFSKLDKFEGVHFRRWQKKMHFLLSTMSMVYVLNTPIPDDGDDATLEQIMRRNKCENDDYVCRGIILNEELTLVELGSHLCIEESLRVQDSDKPKGNNVVGPSVISMVEHNNPIRYNHNKGKRKHQDTKTDPHKKSKVTCWKCGKPKHSKKDCKGGKVSNKANGSSINGSMNDSTNSLKGQNMFNKLFQVYYVTYVSKAYFVQDDDVAWWVDSGATVHVCKDRCWFKTYESLNDESMLHMGNESTALVHGRSCVDLRFSSGKTIFLFNILHVPNIRKNLVSSSIFNNYGYKQVIESDKFALSKHDMFIGFGYSCNQMFRLNIVNDIGNSAFMSTSKLNDSILWHARLSHVHYKRMQDMYKDGLILAFDMDIEKSDDGDLCDLHATPSLGNKKYFVTFIDDASRAVVRLSDPKLVTSGERAIECIFVRYVDHSKAFRFYVIKPNESISFNSITESRDAIIDDNRFSLLPRPSQRSLINRIEDIGGLVVPEEITEKKESINDEMDSIMGNNSRVLADLPPGCKPISYKWIFKRKLKVDGTIEKVKARQVIQGFRQKSGIYYFYTYAPVARISTIRLVITLASIHNWIIHHMDVKTTFLHGELDEEFFQVDLTKEFLSSRFFMNDMGKADVILGIRITHESNGIAISQSHYIKKVLKRFNYFDCTPMSTPMDTSEKLMPDNGQAVFQLEYSRVIGCLMYAMTCTGPNIAFAVGKLSRYTSNPSTYHCQAIQRILKYLKTTIDYSLTYTGYPSVLEGYTDTSWISNTEDNSSTSGWVFLLGGGAISWASKRQTCITSSTIEYEFVTLAAAGKEAKWLRNMILEILLWSKPITLISIQ
ncbi:zinc finger, CCHC-type containing protein [Tanacetum coccineum]